MKNKIIVLVILALLMCGCSTEVNINITSDYVTEEIKISDNVSSTLTKDDIKNEYRNYVPVYEDSEIYDEDPDEEVSGIEYYTHSMEELNNGINNTYSYKYPINKYKKAASVNYAFRSVSVSKSTKDKTITIMTDSNGMLYFNQYPRLDYLKVNITTDLEVLETNGTLVDGVYTWQFYKNDNQKGIYMELKLPEDSSEGNSVNSSENDENTGNISLVIMLLILFIIVLVIIVGLTKFTKKQ